MADEPLTLTVAEASERTGLSKKSIRNRIDRGQLRTFLRGGLRRIPVSELERLGLLDRAAEQPQPERRVDGLLKRLDRLLVELRVAVEAERQQRDK